MILDRGEIVGKIEKPQHIAASKDERVMKLVHQFTDTGTMTFSASGKPVDL